MTEDLKERLKQYAVFLEGIISETDKHKQETYGIGKFVTEQITRLYTDVRNKLYELIPETILISEAWRGRVPVRFAVNLQKLGISTIGDLADKTEEELIATKRFGNTSLQELRDGLLKPFGFDYRKQEEKK